MSGFGGLNKAPNGVVIGVVQLQLPDPHTKAALWDQTLVVCNMVEKARKGYPRYLTSMAAVYYTSQI